MKRILIYITFSLFCLSCEELVDWDLQEVFPPRLVVDAMITNQPGYNYVRLNLPVTESGGRAFEVSNAIVSISTEDSTISFIKDETTPGLFVPEYPVRGLVNRVYRLDIQLEDFAFFAFAYMIGVDPLGDFNYREASDSSGFYRIIPSDTQAPSMTRYTVEWQNPDLNEIQKSVFYHYTISTVDVNQFFQPEKESLIFPENSRIIREQYSLSPDHEQFIRTLLSETEWKGGWFDVFPGNLHTNLSRGGVGYFGASSLVTDTVFFK
jgi:hypothetical protein